MEEKNVLPRFVKFAYQAHKKYFYVMMFSSLVTSAQTIFSAYTISLLIGCIEKGQLERAYQMVALIAVVEIILLLLNKLMKRLLEIHRVAMQEIINQKTSEKIMSLPFAYLEDPYYMELKKNVQMGINNMGAVYLLCDGFFKIISNILSLAGLGLIIFTFDPVLVAILLIGILLNIILVKLSMRSQIRFFHELLPINYKYGYYMDTIISDKNGKDFRLYSQFNLLFKKFNGFAEIVANYFTSFNLEQSFYQTLISIVRYVQMAFVYALVGIKTIVTMTNISSFSLTVSAAISFSDCITNMIQVSSNFMRSIEYVKPLLELLDIQEDQHEGKVELKEIRSITFDHVSFAYPNTDKLILDDITFTIYRNEKISIVGLNGAGKTTIVKLICRLYEPTKGQILINDVPICEYDHRSYMSMVSSVFQDYKMFAITIKDNISFHIDEEKARELSYDTGVGEIVEQLPNKWQSILSKAYDEKGVELSGGQNQKIAIARALAKPADLLILDEPTSALDPIAEAEIYENFNELAKERMAIYISHRMSSSIFCDRILVIDGGRISDFDTHKNLMEKKESLYYKLFMTQAQNYAL